jgi:hypothetical protein
MGMSRETQSTGRKPLRLIGLVVLLIALAGTLYWVRSLPKPGDSAPALLDEASQTSPQDRFGHPDYLGGPELALNPDLETSGRATFAAAKNGEIAARQKFDEAAAKQKAQNFQVPAEGGSADRVNSDEKLLAYRLEVLAAYRKLTADTGAARQAGDAFLEAFLTKGDGSQTPEPEVLTLGEAAISAGALDPLVRLYFAVGKWRTNPGKAPDQMLAAGERFDQVANDVIPELCGGRYPAIVPMNLRVWADEVQRKKGYNSYSNRWTNAVIAIVRWLEADSSRLEIRRPLFDRLYSIWKSAPGGGQPLLLAGLMESTKVDPWFPHLFAGMYYQDRGATLRGRDNSEENEASVECLLRATAHLRYAWSLAPECPEASTMLIGLSAAGYDKSQSKLKMVLPVLASDPKPYDWFLRAMEANLTYRSAYQRLWEQLRPAAGGSVEDMTQFAKSCLQNEHFDTFIPFYGIDLLHNIEQTEQPIRLEELDIGRTLLAFLEHRNAYRAAHPGESLYGDSPYYRTALALLLERFDFLPEALAEAHAAGEDVDVTQFQQWGRPGRRLWDRLAAAQGANRQKVLDFDRRLQAPFFAVGPADAVHQLEEDCAALEKSIASTDEWTARYFRSSRTIIEQVKTFQSGQWVNLKFEPGLPGWEYYGATPKCSDDGETAVFSRRFENSGPATIELLARLTPPFEIEAEIQSLEPEPHIPFAGIYLGGGEYWMNNIARFEPHVMLIEWKDGDGKYLRESGRWLGPQQTPRTERFENPGQARKIVFQIWDEIIAGQFGPCFFVSRSSGQSEYGAPLRIGEPGIQDQKTHPVTLDSSFRISHVRLRSLKTPQPPDRFAPLAEQEKYWTQRLSEDPANPRYVAMLCEIRYAQDRLEEAAALADQLAAMGSYSLPGQIKALKVFAEKRYAEALPLLQATDGDNYRVMSAIGEIRAGAPDESLRQAEESGTPARAGEAYARYAFGSGGGSYPEAYGAFAMAVAAGGDFETARKTNQQGIQLCEQRENARLKAELERRQKLYEANQPAMLP